MLTEGQAGWEKKAKLLTHHGMRSLTLMNFSLQYKYNYIKWTRDEHEETYDPSNVFACKPLV